MVTKNKNNNKINLNNNYNKNIKKLYEKKILYYYEKQDKNEDIELIKTHKVKKNFILNFYYFYKNNLPKYIIEDKIEELKKVKNVYIYLKNIEKREKIPIHEFNIYTSFFHENTIKWLEIANFEGLQKFKTYKNNNVWESFIKFNKDLYYNFSQNILKSVIIDGSLTNMLHGMRLSDDIDLAAVTEPSEERDKLYNYIIEKKEIMKKTELDIYLKNKVLWENNTPNVLNNFCKNHNINNYNTLVKSNKYSYYFYGIKIINYNLYIASSSDRGYPKNVFDTIQARRILKITYPLKPFDNNMKIGNKIYSNEIFIKTVKFYYKKFLNENVEEKDIEKYLKPHFKLYKEIHKNK